jgi:hypothetical protein
MIHIIIMGGLPTRKDHLEVPVMSSYIKMDFGVVV